MVGIGASVRASIAGSHAQGLADRVLAGEGAVRNRDTLSDEGGDGVLPLEHGVDVTRVDGARFHEGRTGLLDRIIAIRSASEKSIVA